MTKFCRRYLSLRCSHDGKVVEKQQQKSIGKYGKTNKNSWKCAIFPQFIFQKKIDIIGKNLKQKLRVLQFCTYTLPSWLFLRKKLRYCCINLIFYHSFFQNHTKIIAVLIFEKRHGSYRVNLSAKTKNSVKNLIQWWFFLWICCRNEPNCTFGWKWLYRQKSVPGPMGPRGPRIQIFFIKKEFFFFRVFMVEKISASYFKIPGIWTLYSINLINHEPPWRRVDHSVTFLRQYPQSRYPSIYLGTRK